MSEQFNWFHKRALYSAEWDPSEGVIAVVNGLYAAYLDDMIDEAQAFKIIAEAIWMMTYDGRVDPGPAMDVTFINRRVGPSNVRALKPREDDLVRIVDREAGADRDISWVTNE
jgi:hypothetical protein